MANSLRTLMLFLGMMSCSPFSVAIRNEESFPVQSEDLASTVDRMMFEKNVSCLSFPHYTQRDYYVSVIPALPPQNPHLERIPALQIEVQADGGDISLALYDRYPLGSLDRVALTFYTLDYDQILIPVDDKRVVTLYSAVLQNAYRCLEKIGSQHTMTSTVVKCTPSVAYPEFVKQYDSLLKTVQKEQKKNKEKKRIYRRARTNTARKATIIVAGTNRVRIARKILLITGATTSKNPSCTPR